MLATTNTLVIESLTPEQCTLPLFAGDSSHLDAFSQRSRLKAPETPWMKDSPLWKNEYSAADLPDLLELLQGGNENYLCVARAVRKLLSIENNPPTQDIVNSGFVPHLVDWLQRSDFLQLQFEAAWALTNIASGSSPQCQHFVQLGMIPMLINLIESPNDDIKEQAIWALGNISGDSTTCRDLVLQSFALPFLAECLFTATRKSLQSNCGWTVSNLCRGKPRPNYLFVGCSVPAIAHAVKTHSSDESLIDCMWAFSYISDDCEAARTAIMESGVGPDLVGAVSSSNNPLVLPAVRTLGNFASGNIDETQYILSIGALPPLAMCLGSPKRSIRKEVMWVLSNIAASSRAEVRVLMSAGVFPTVLQMLADDSPDIKKEAVWVVLNALSEGDCGEYLLSIGAAQRLCGVLNAQDSKLVLIALDALEHLLKNHADSTRAMIESCNGTEAIEQLRSHANLDVYQKACTLLETHFADLED